MGSQVDDLIPPCLLPPQDLLNQRLYWVDSKRHELASVDFSGHNRRILISSSDFLSHPFGIAVFEVSTVRECVVPPEAEGWRGVRREAKKRKAAQMFVHKPKAACIKRPCGPLSAW